VVLTQKFLLRGVNPTMMNSFRPAQTLVKPMIRFAIGGFLATGALVVGASAQAQTPNTTAQPLQDFQTRDGGSDFFNGGGSGSGFMNFMQNAIQGANKRDPNEVASEQQENVNDATAKFRAKQSELLRKQQSSPSTAPDLTNFSPSSSPVNK
jgi:hypothetical protein